MALPNATAPTRIHSEYSFVLVAPLLTAPNEENEPTWTSTGVLLNTVQDVNGGSSSSGDEWYSIGSASQIENEKIDEEVSITILRPHDQDELTTILGITGAITGTKLEIQPENKIWVNVQHYIAAGETLVGSEVWKHVQWNNVEMTQSADGYAQYVFSGIAKRIYEKYIPDPS